MAGRLWIVNYLEPMDLEKRVGRVLSETRPPGSNKLITALVEASDPQVNRLKHLDEVVNVRPVSAPIESTQCVAVSAEGVRCGKPASVPDALWGGLICEKHAAMGERMRHRESVNRLLDTIEGLESQIDQIIATASTARDEGEKVSVLVAELLLGVQAHLSSGKESLGVVKSTLRSAMKDPE